MMKTIEGVRPELGPFDEERESFILWVYGEDSLMHFLNGYYAGIDETIDGNAELDNLEELFDVHERSMYSGDIFSIGLHKSRQEKFDLLLKGIERVIGYLIISLDIFVFVETVDFETLDENYNAECCNMKSYRFHVHNKVWEELPNYEKLQYEEVKEKIKEFMKGAE